METVHLDKGPPCESRGGLLWGSWDGKLAIVDRYTESFDPEKMERCYVVRFALDLNERTPIVLTAREAEHFIGRDVRVLNSRVPYEQTTWTLGSQHYADYRTGGFSGATQFFVKTTLTELSDQEHARLVRLLWARKWLRVETKRTQKVLKAMLARSFTDLQADHYEVANEADRILRAAGFDTCKSNDECDRAWADLRKRGIYCEARNGRVKWFIEPE